MKVLRFMVMLAAIAAFLMPPAYAQSSVPTQTNQAWLAQVQQEFSQSLSPTLYQDFLSIVQGDSGSVIDVTSLYLQMMDDVVSRIESAEGSGNAIEQSIFEQDKQAIIAALPAPAPPDGMPSSSLGVNTGSPAGPAPSRPVVGQVRNGLAPTMLDSFVFEAGAQGELIYGDEGLKRPPYMNFTYEHRINAGIVGRRDQGLTTGHGTYMPDAWGADEFIAPPGEWSMSGANRGNLAWNDPGVTLARPINPVDPVDPTVSTYDNTDPNANPGTAPTQAPGASPLDGAKYNVVISPAIPNQATLASPSQQAPTASGF